MPVFNLLANAGRLFRPSTAKAQPSRKEVLRLRPLRNPALEWFEQEDRVVLHVKRTYNWKTRLFGIFVPLPNDRHIVLDAIGTDVWRMIDGQSSIAGIARALSEKYKLSQKEAELSVQQFFQDLGRRGYIGFAVEPGKQDKDRNRGRS